MILDLSCAERMGGHREDISAAIVKCCPGLRYLEVKHASPAAMKLIDELELEKLVLNDTFVGYDGWRPHHSAMSMGFDHCSGLHASNVSLICSTSSARTFSATTKTPSSAKTSSATNATRPTSLPKSINKDGLLPGAQLQWGSWPPSYRRATGG
jgi:hypothetical protein